MEKPTATVGQILKTFWGAMRRYPWTLAALWSCVILAVTTSIITPLYYKNFFDLLNGAVPSDALAVALVHIILWILFFNVLGWIFWRTATFINNYYEPRVSVDLKRRSFDYLMEHSYGFFADNFGGSLVQKVNRLSRSFETLFDNIIWTLLPLLTRIVGISVILWIYNPVIAGVLLIWMAVFMFVNFFLSQWKVKYDMEAAAKDSETTGAMADAITNHTNIQLFTAFSRESKLFRGISESMRRITKRAWDIDAAMEALQALFMSVAEFLLFYYGIHYWRLGVITLGIFVLIQAYLLQMIGQMWDFGRTVRYIYRSIADAEEMTGILNMPHDIQDVPVATPLRMKKGTIEFENTEFSFNETRKVLRKINLKIKPGEKVALIGPSGAGKSTVVKLLLRLYDLEGGCILIDGQDIHTVTQESLRQNVSLVPQDPILFHRSLFENIRYGKPDATMRQVEKAATQAYCDEFIELLPEKYDTFVGERGIKLSGGERQRIAIARAILKNAPILILDEATSSLDSRSEMLIQSALENLMRGKTVIVIAHRLSTIRSMDRIVVMENGGIREEGTHESLLATPGSLYARLWKLQAGGFIKNDGNDEYVKMGE